MFEPHPSHLYRVTRKRPTDATGLFWALVCIAFGTVLFLAIPILGVMMFAYAPFCLVSQFFTWRNERKAKHESVAWCNRHFTSGVDFPLLDFIIALAIHTGCSLHDIDPDTELTDIYGMLADDWIDLSEVQWHQLWLADVFEDAKIRIQELDSFQGNKLSDAIRFIETNAV